MARVALPKVDTAGVYAALVRYWEADFETWVRNASRTHADDAAYPFQRILDDLVAGRPVNVPTYSLPRDALLGAPTRPWPPAQDGGCGNGVIWPQRAIVTTDDRINYTDDDATRLWLEENGL
ncbi:hypothetical protein MMARE11_19870 [Mycobacterium marinum E11]|nr:hypothetical protein MMARE11_19870 [Mycobacterium marinum E11]